MSKIVLPKNYKWREFNWMPHGRFDSILNGARAAMEKFNRGNDWDDARLKCAREQVVAISYEEVNLTASTVYVVFVGLCRMFWTGRL